MLRRDKLGKGDWNLEELQEITCTMEVKKKNKIGECTILKKGAINTNINQRILFFVKLPSFSGDSDPNVYLGWEARVEKIFNVYEVEEDQKVRLASLVFLDYAIHWWQ